MAISRAKKEKILKDLTKKLKKAKLLILLDFQKVTVPEVQILRKVLKKEGIDYLVAKKTLVQKALQKNKIKDLVLKDLKVPVSLIISKEADPAAARIIKDFQNKTKKTEFLKGFLEGKMLEKNDLIMLAGIPSREELLAKLISSIASPISGLTYALKGNLTSLVSVLSQVSKKKTR